MGLNDIGAANPKTPAMIICKKKNLWFVCQFREAFENLNSTVLKESYQNSREDYSYGSIICVRFPPIWRRVPVFVDVIGGDSQLDKAENEYDYAPETVIDSETSEYYVG